MAILSELEERKYFFKDQIVTTVYFGGGTPSLLDIAELEGILHKIYSLFSIDSNAEVTLEANPDDLLPEKIKQLVSLPINRLSIGVQSFADVDLKFMNRGHTAQQAYSSIKLSQDAGFENISVDLIYGSPTTTDSQWRRNLEQVAQHNIPHLSCYCLTIEEKTALAHYVKTGRSKPVDEEQAARQFIIMLDVLETSGYEHYEISNFAWPGRQSRHNSAYWTGDRYLGIGPAAHSFSGMQREWNMANNAEYIRKLLSTDGPGQRNSEELTISQRYNEYVMTSLRTAAGSDLVRIQAFGQDLYHYFIKNMEPFLTRQDVYTERGRYILTRSGKLLADHIASSVFFI